MSKNKSGNRKKARLLIVDDQPVNIQALSVFLKAEYHIQAATLGAKALEIARSERQPDLILLDIKMPDMDGYEVCRQLKADAYTRDISVIFLTALTAEEDEEKGLILGADDYISKPFNPGIVKVRVRNQIERKQAEKEIKKQLSEKELILKEVNHRIKNNFGTIESLLQLQTQSIDHPETQSALQDAVARVQSMRVLYEQLLISDEQEELSVKDYVESLADSIVASFPDADRITLEKQIADFSLASNRLFNVGIMINELLTNAMKYAFRGKETGKLMVSVGKVDKQVTLTVQDDGNGLPEGFDASQSQGFGLMLVTMLSQQLKGSYDMENANGTRCRIEFEV